MNEPIVTYPIPSKRIKNLTSKRFDRLLVLGYAGLDPNRHESLWLCACDCGNSITLRAGALTTGNTTSCGCYGREQAQKAMTESVKTHGMSYEGSAEYRTWRNMRNRCLSETNPRYADYGGRGIKICDQWNDFAVFLADMGKRPSPKHSLDRIDVNGDYAPGNCRWATDSEQGSNKRNNLVITFNGETMNVTQWARKIGINRQTLVSRVTTLGWSVERALTEPLDPRFR